MQRTLIVGMLVIGVIAAILLIARPGTDDSDEPAGVMGSDAMDAGVASRPGDRSRPLTPEETRASTAAAVEADEAIARGRFARGVEIISLGTAPTGITPDALYDALMPNELAFAQCVTRAGGFDAMREAMRAARQLDDRPRDPASTPSGPRVPRTEPSTAMVPPRTSDPGVAPRRTGRSAGFDVKPDGTVDPSTIVLDPDVPAPFRACFIDHVGAIVLSNAGSDGAHVQMPMPGPRQRGPVPLTADGGVPIPTPSAERRAIAP